MEELAKWLLTLNPSDITITGLILATVALAGWLLGSDRIVLGSRYRDVVADRDRLREAGETCAKSKEDERDEKLELRQSLQQAVFERDWYLRQQQQERPT